MRAYLMVPVGADHGSPPEADALVLDGRVGTPPPLRAAGGAMTGRRILVRVGPIENPDLDAGLAAAAALRPDAIVLPARHGRDVAHLGSRLAVLEAEHGLSDGSVGIVALVSCAAGVLAAASFAGASPRLRGLGWDAEALARQLGLPEGRVGSAGCAPLAQARATVRLAAAAAGVEAIEAAYAAEDAAGLGAHVAAARRDGFGAMFVHDPAHVPVVRAEV